MTELNSTQLYFSQNCCRQKQCPCFHSPGTHTRQVGFVRSCSPCIALGQNNIFTPIYDVFLPPSQLGIQGKQPTGILITGSKPRMRITPSELTRQSCRDKLPGLFSSFLEFLFIFVHFLAWLASARLCCPNVSSTTLVTDGIIRGRHLADRQPPKPNNKYELAAWPQGYRVESLLTRLTADEQKPLVAIRHLINGG